MTTGPERDVRLPTWREQSLHHWLVLARKYGSRRPARLQRKYDALGEAEREEFMRRLLSLPAGEARTVNDPWGVVLTLNDRVIQKTLDNAPRTHAVAWLRFAIANAIERWEKPVQTKLGPENRTYHLAAINEPEKRSVVVISFEGVVFNVIDCDPPYVENLRCGTLLQTRDEDNRRYCTSHDCCDDVVAMEGLLTKTERERAAAIDEAKAAKRRLNMKNPPAKSGRRGTNVGE